MRMFAIGARPCSSPKRLAKDVKGLALLEFGLALPLLVVLGCGGIELANYSITKMRVSQVALQIADNASRMGDPVQGIKIVSEANIAETFAGGALQAGSLDLLTNGRVVLSSLEPVANPNSVTNPRYKIQWQRCYGGQAHPSGFGVQGDTNLTGMGPSGRKVSAQDYDATMFVEVYYVYKPVFYAGIAPGTSFDEIAAMAVRDPRTLGGLPTSGGTVASC